MLKSQKTCHQNQNARSKRKNRKQEQKLKVKSHLISSARLSDVYVDIWKSKSAHRLIHLRSSLCRAGRKIPVLRRLGSNRQNTKRKKKSKKTKLKKPFFSKIQQRFFHKFSTYHLYYYFFV